MRGLEALKGKFHFERSFTPTGVLVSLIESKSGRKRDLPSHQDDLVEVAKWEPDVADALIIVSRLVKQFEALEIPEEVVTKNVGLFSEEELRKKPIEYQSGGILFPYKTIAAIRFSELTADLGLSEEHLRLFGVPEYTSFQIQLTAVSNYRRSDFRIQIAINDANHDPINPGTLNGHSLQSLDSQSHLITPSVAALILRMRQHMEATSKPEYRANANLRAKELAEIRQLGLNANASLDNFLKNENIVYLEELPYLIGRGVNDEVVLSPALPIEHSGHDIKFQEDLSTYSKGSAPQLNLGINRVTGERKRVFFAEKAWKQCLRIKEYNAQGQQKLEQIISDPEKFFDGQVPREKLAATFSTRVVGFIFGKLRAEGIERNSKTDWVAGIEEQCTILRTASGAAIPISYKPAPELYARIKERTLQFKDELERDVAMQREAAGLFLTPLPPGEDRKVTVDELDADFNLRDLENFVRRVEYENRPKLEESEIEEARALVNGATSRAEFLVTWAVEQGGESVETRIPVKSLKDALPKDRPKVEDRVSLKVSEDRKSRIGIAPQWHWKTCDHSLFEKPEGLKNVSLRVHQRRGFAWLKWLLEHDISGAPQVSHRGALLADDMGLGKTIQVIALIAHLRCLESKKEKPILIVSPLGLIRSSWIRDGFKKFVENDLLGYDSLIDQFKFIRNFSECPYFFDKLKLKHEALAVQQEMDSGKPFHECSISADVKTYLNQIQIWFSGNIVITSYETMRLNSLALGSVDFSLVILDEAQKIKNAGALQSNSAKALKADMCVAMSGTPIENTLMDLWNIMDFVFPGYLPPKDEFRRKFVLPTRELAVGSPEREELRKRLESALEPIWMRRTKAEVLRGAGALPPIYHHDEEKAADGTIHNAHMVSMSQEQEVVYQEYSAHFQHAQGGQRLAALQGMLQACACPWLASNTKVSFANKDRLYRLSPKLETTMKVLEGIRRGAEEAGKKVLIFANIIQLQNSLAWFIADWHKSIFGEHLEVEVYNGELREKAREHVLNRFEGAQGFGVLILSPKAGGTGLNLTCANHVIHYTREWNPAVERQATDRVYRIGQKRPVHVYYPTTRMRTGEAQSAEEHLANLLRSKRELMDDFTICPADLALSEEDLAPEVARSPQDDVRVLEQHLLTLSPKDFEAVVAVLYERLGYQTWVVGKAGDYGGDVVCLGHESNLLIQAKHALKGGTTGTKAIQEVRGARSTYENNWQKKFRLVAVTSSRFNEDAYNLAANGDPVELVERPKLKVLLEQHTVTRGDLARKLRERAKAA